ncbi:transposase, IS605 OrfB family [Streptomyces hygroscopicus]|nr:transposase, IS605 OrfB family [Streptomyces hygroscopicus]
MLTQWKKTQELAYLNEVSSVPLQQALRHLQTAFTHFFAQRARHPRFKSRKKSRKSAEYTTSAFRFQDGKNGRLARAISDAAWSAFRSMLEYKARWYGREVIAVDRWFPSSKLCSHCGTLQDKMPLSVRTWTCGSCGVTHDRDVNAARNILAAGLAVSACGAGVRPQRSSPGGQSAMKQEIPRREP